MKYPFQKKSFWIILTGSFLIIFLFPPFIYYPGTIIGPYFFISWGPIDVRIFIFEMVVAFLLNYLGHLVFSKTETK